MPKEQIREETAREILRIAGFGSDEDAINIGIGFLKDEGYIEKTALEESERFLKNMTKHETALEKFEDFFKDFENTYFNSENVHFNVCKLKKAADAAIKEAKEASK